MRVHFTVWWDALIHPDRAASLVLDRSQPLRFDVFLVLLSCSMYAAYGLTMGLFRGYLPSAVSSLKLPFLYLFAIGCCLPYIYVMNALIGPRLPLRSCVRLFLLGLSANAVALASYAPVSAFFAVTTSSDGGSGYRFLLLMHVVAFSVAGAATVGEVSAIFRAVNRGMGKPIRHRFILAFAIMYAFVGTQMAWVLRPWLGSPDTAYAPLRAIEGSFVEFVYRLVLGL